MGLLGLGFHVDGVWGCVVGLSGFLGLGLFIETTKDNLVDIEIVPAALRI